MCIWDILSGDCEQKFRFPSPVLKVQFDPRNDSRCLVCPMRYAAVLVDINGTHKCLPLDSDVRFVFFFHWIVCLFFHLSQIAGWFEYNRFVRSTRQIYLHGKCKGQDFSIKFAFIENWSKLSNCGWNIECNGRKEHWICQTKRVREFCGSDRIESAFHFPILPFFFSSFLINTSDRIIRVYDAKEVIACGKDGEPEPIQKLQDLVNK